MTEIWLELYSPRIWIYLLTTASSTAITQAVTPVGAAQSSPRVTSRQRIAHSETTTRLAAMELAEPYSLAATSLLTTVSSLTIIRRAPILWWSQWAERAEYARMVRSSCSEAR